MWTMQVLWREEGEELPKYDKEEGEELPKYDNPDVEAKTFPYLGNIQLQFQICWKANSGVGNK